MATVTPWSPRWLLRGDIDGFLGLGLDSLITILIVIGLCRGVLGFSEELIARTILSAIGVSVLVGNTAYGPAGVVARSSRGGLTTAQPCPMGSAPSASWPMYFW